MRKATHQQTKGHNSRLVLKTVYDLGVTTRADIARSTKLTRPTVSAIVGDLMAEGFVNEDGQGPSAGGKRPTLLRFNSQARQVLCLDLSGSEFRGAVADLNGQMLRRADVPAENARGEEAFALVSGLVEELHAAAAAPLLGIGVGTPGLVDPVHGAVLRAVNLGWEAMPLGPRLSEQFDLPVHVSNDSHAAVLAEYRFGAPNESANLIAIRIGRGVGAGVVLGARPFYGDGFGAGEIGHVVVDSGGERCTCGNTGCLETTSSTRAMVRASGCPDWEAFVEAVLHGDPAALAVAERAGSSLGIAIAHLIGCYNIQHIVLSGRVSALGDSFLGAVRAEARRRVLPVMAEATSITYSALGREAVLLGSSALVIQRELGII